MNKAEQEEYKQEFIIELDKKLEDIKEAILSVFNSGIDYSTPINIQVNAALIGYFRYCTDVSSMGDINLN